MTPSTAWRETIGTGEARKLQAYAAELGALQARNARDGRTSRALHAKGAPGLLAQFAVPAGLPAHARAGLFASPATYAAYVRFSNGAGRLQHDARPDVRGIAFKLVGVPGRKLIPGMENSVTQDFLLINTPSTPVRDVHEFMGLVRIPARPLPGLLRFIAQVGPRRFLQIAKAAAAELKKPVTSLATIPYFSALPSQFGAYAVHFRLRPRQTATSAASGRGAAPSANYLAEELAARVASDPLSFDFQAQFFVDEARTPIEDASVEWKESDAPFVTLGRLDIPRQDPASPRGRRVQEFVERLAFDPWHSQAEFKPLGNMMRARNVAYRTSTQARGAAAEPDGNEAFD